MADISTDKQDIDNRLRNLGQTLIRVSAYCCQHPNLTGSDLDKLVGVAKRVAIANVKAVKIMLDLNERGQKGGHTNG